MDIEEDENDMTLGKKFNKSKTMKVQLGDLVSHDNTHSIVDDLMNHLSPRAVNLKLSFY